MGSDVDMDQKNAVLILLLGAMDRRDLGWLLNGSAFRVQLQNHSDSKARRHIRTMSKHLFKTDFFDLISYCRWCHFDKCRYFLRERSKG